MPIETIGKILALPAAAYILRVLRYLDKAGTYSVDEAELYERVITKVHKLGVVPPARLEIRDDLDFLEKEKYVVRNAGAVSLSEDGKLIAADVTPTTATANPA